jgi:hypothetical protein
MTTAKCKSCRYSVTTPVLGPHGIPKQGHWLYWYKVMDQRSKTVTKRQCTYEEDLEDGLKEKT